jgi:hypothetical protein
VLAAIDVEVTNRGPDPVALGSPIQCGGPLYVAVESLNDASPGGWASGGCAFTCDIALTRGLACDPSCNSAAALLIRAGESASVTWSPVVWEPILVPPACCNVDPCPEQCPLVHAAEPGSYRATLAVVPLTDEEADECEATPGTCGLRFSDPSRSTRVALDFEFDGEPFALEIP